MPREYGELHPPVPENQLDFLKRILIRQHTPLIPDTKRQRPVDLREFRTAWSTK